MRRDTGAMQGAACVYVSSKALATAKLHVGDGSGGRSEASQISLRADPLEDLSELGACLKSQLASLSLTKSERQHVNMVLAPEFYPLLMVDKPQATSDEINDAARWQIQEQVDFDVADAVLDTFPLPDGATREREMIYVAAVQNPLLKGIVGELQAAGLSLRSVDIAELALRNLAWHCFPMADQSVALLRLSTSSGLINLSRGPDLYLARRISGVPADLSNQAWQDFRERLLLQVQRSVDYYEGTMGQPGCNLLIVASTHSWNETVCDYLAEQLPIPVRSVGQTLAGELDLVLHNPEARLVDWDAMDIEQRNALAAGLPAVGGVLRETLHRVAEAA